MTARRVSEDTAITGASVAAGDLWTVVDVSDTTDAASGTNKKITTTNARLALAADPATLSRLTAPTVATVSGIASGVQTFAVWDTPTDLVGTDLEVDGGDATLVNILTDGVYAVTAYGLGDALLSDMDWSQTTLLAGPHALDRFLPVSGLGIDDPISWTGFLEAGDTVSFAFQIHTVAGTWTLTAAAIWVQRLA